VGTAATNDARCSHGTLVASRPQEEGIGVAAAPVHLQRQVETLGLHRPEKEVQLDGILLTARLDDVDALADRRDDDPVHRPRPSREERVVRCA
jgi:hypothetical protein